MPSVYRSPVRLGLIALALSLSPSIALAQQPGKDGPLTVAAQDTVLNKYATLAANKSAGATTIDVTNPGGGDGLDPSTLTAGDLLLVMQMQGASMDTSYRVVDFGSGNDESYALALQSDGKIVVAGYATGANQDFAVMRFLEDGRPDTSFDGDGWLTTTVGAANEQAIAVTIQTDGKIVAAGFADMGGGNNDFAVVRYQTNGALDGTFGVGGKVTTPIGAGDDQARSVAVQTDGKIVVAGWSNNGANNDVALVRYDANGVLDGGFGTGGIVTTPIGPGHDEGFEVAIQTDGKIVVAGDSANAGGNDDIVVLRYLTGGGLDGGFGTGGIATTPIGAGDDSARGLALQSDGKIIVSGSTWNGANFDFAILRYSTGGILDGTFAVGGIRTVALGSSHELSYGVALQSNGRIVATGWAHNGSDWDYGLVRLTSGGNLDTSFDVDGKLIAAVGNDNAFGEGVVIHPDGRIFVAGPTDNSFDMDFGLVGFNADGTYSYGTVLDLQGAGNYELVSVASVAGNTITLDCTGGLLNDYTVAGNTQVVRVPQYSTLTVTGSGSIIAPPWNGQYGGVVALHVQGTATIDGEVLAASLGFRGGSIDAASADQSLDWPDLASTYGDVGGEKGEGIVGSISDYDALGGRYGRGAPANGGGGGGAHNAAGGGGANANSGGRWTGQGYMDGSVVGAAAWALDPGYIANANALTTSPGGGRGGYSFSSSNADALTVAPGNASWGGNDRRERGGLGGHPLDNDPLSRLFMGGGGGAGDGNGGGAGPGGDGGGIVILIADTVNGTGTLDARGEQGDDTNNPHEDAPGGGGGGGSIVVSATSLTGVSILVDGGHGGNQGLPVSWPDEAEGGGGGGGGGFVAVSGGFVSRTATGEIAGTSLSNAVTEFPTNGGTRGAPGQANELLVGLSGRCLTLSCSPQINYRSVGTDAGILHQDGLATINAGSNEVNFSAPANIPTHVGQGDEIVIGATTFYILSRVSSTRVTVQSIAGATLSGQAYTIQRAYNTFQAWETARDGNLVGENRREIAVAYDDGARGFADFTAGATISGSTTDNCHYMHVTVASGQRHFGVLGAGVLIDSPGGAQVFQVRDEFTRIEGLQIEGATVTNGVIFVDSEPTAPGRYAFLSHLLISNFNSASEGALQLSHDSTVRNTIVYNGDRGIQVDMGATATIENVTVYNMTTYGVQAGDQGVTDVTIRNTISVGNGWDDFSLAQTISYFGYNMFQTTSSFDPVACSGCAGNNQTPPVLLDDLFVTLSPMGSEDLHLEVGSAAIDNGLDLSSLFSDDIDGEFRALGTGWEIGADESFVTGGCPVSNPTWYDADWGYRTAVVINSSQVTATHTDFPVLIQLASDAALAADAQDDGDDILFTLTDGVTKLSHEIEYFDGTTGELVAWVKVPFLSSGSDTILYMYFGNALVGSQQDKYGTWTNGYEGVWHLSEASGSGAYILNSTENDHHGDPTGTAYNATGRIDGARDFQNSGTHAIALANSTPFFDGWPQFSYEFWVRPDYSSDAVWEAAGENFVLEPDVFAPIWLVRIRRQNFNPAGRGEIQSDIQFAGAGTQYVIVGLRRQQWDHVLYSYNGNTFKIYVNGQVRYNDPSIVGDSLTASSALWAIGSGGNALNGSLDEVRFASKGRYDEWVQTQYNNQSNPSAFFNLCGPTTEVELQAFEAVAGEDEVELRWKTASELDNLGFHLYRSTSARGPFERITSSLIPGLGSSPVGAEYRHLDTDVVNGVTYYYELEDIETTGKRTRHGPISATPGNVGPSPEPGPSHDTENEDREMDSSNVWGSPSGNAFRILEQRPGFVVLELLTEGFYTEELDDGSVSVSIPGFVSQTSDDVPDVPVKRAWLEATSNRNARVTSIRELDVQVITGMSPTDTTTPEIVVDARGAVRAEQRRLRRTRGDRMPGLFPSESARILEDGYQGTTRKLLVEMAPLRWDSGRQELVLARRLEVRIDFAGSERRKARRRNALGARKSLAARLVTTERGLHAVRFEELPGTKRRALPASEIRLSRLGHPIAYHLEPEGGSFGPGSTLYFFSEGPSLNPYGSEVVYELDAGVEGGAMTTIDGTTGGRLASTFYWQRDAFEENRYYQAALLDAPDLWLWDLVSARQTKSFPFEIRDLEHTHGEARVEIWLQGASDFLAEPDHHVRLFVNEHFVMETSWDGKDAKHISASLPEGILRAGENTLVIENVGDTEAEYSMVMLDRFSVEYPRRADATDGRLEGIWNETGLADVSGIDSEAFVLDVTGGEPKWLVASGPPLRFPTEAGHRYFISSRDSVLLPEIRASKSVTLIDGRRPPEYLVIGPRAFLEAASELLAHRRAQGLETAAVATEDIYDALGFGETRPEAIQDFIEATYHAPEATASLRYVLLLGDATYDFKNHYGLGAVNQVPPLMIRTRYLWTASDPSLAAVNGDDPLPDIAIGRLPASNVEEVEAVVRKILEFETGDRAPEAPIVMVTDNPDRAGDFVRDAEALAQDLLTGGEARFIHLSELGADATRAAVTEAFDRGASIMSYSGHGGIHLWAGENIFEIGDVEKLSPQSHQPILVTMNCLNGYFHFPFFDSLSEALVEADGRGAIAAFSPAGLSLNEPANLFHRALMKALVDPRYQRLGDAVMAAQQTYAETGALPELLRIYHLLGDPALALR